MELICERKEAPPLLIIRIDSANNLRGREYVRSTKGAIVEFT